MISACQKYEIDGTYICKSVIFSILLSYFLMLQLTIGIKMLVHRIVKTICPCLQYFFNCLICLCFDNVICFSVAMATLLGVL